MAKEKGRKTAWDVLRQDFEEAATSPEVAEPDETATPVVTEEQPEPAAVIPVEQPVQRRRKMGKRSNPDYEQVGIYIPRETNLKVKQRLLGQKQDFSDLVTELLNNWLSGESVK